MLATKADGAAAEGIDFMGQVSIEPDFRAVSLVMTASHIGLEHLNAHAFNVDSQVLHTVLGKITLAPLQGVGVKNQREGVLVDEHGGGFQRSQKEAR
ncbi:hypothetical protein [Marinobacter vulgaris]|uniref:hypothetical protein n=1 Tax=Marinobacter vulgaris TaxID=1928331 RepID=UPI001D0DA6FC|nr:hypothetical protein [Marinobacter vulgaris]